MTLAWMLVIVGVVIGATSILGGMGVLKPNPLVGIRTRPTRRSAAAWKAGHARAAVLMAPAGVIFVLLGIGRLLGWTFLTGSPNLYGFFGIGAVVAVTIIGAVMAGRAADSV